MLEPGIESAAFCAVFALSCPRGFGLGFGWLIDVVVVVGDERIEMVIACLHASMET